MSVQFAVCLQQQVGFQHLVGHHLVPHIGSTTTPLTALVGRLDEIQENGNSATCTYDLMA